MIFVNLYYLLLFVFINNHYDLSYLKNLKGVIIPLNLNINS